MSARNSTNNRSGGRVTNWKDLMESKLDPEQIARVKREAQKIVEQEKKRRKQILEEENDW